MRQIATLIFVTLLYGLNYGQDLIVTKSNDSINCKINKVRSDYIYFIFKKRNAYENTLIARTEVSNFQYKFFQGEKIPKDSIPGYEKYPRHLFSISGGLSHDPGRREPGFLSGFDDYLRDLRSGYNVGGDYSYFLNKTFGVGLMVNYFNTSANQENVPGTDGLGNPVVSSLSNEIRVFYVGPSFALRVLNRTQKNAFVWNTSIGYIDYQDTYFYVEERVTSGSGLGTVSTLGYNFGINDNLALGVQLGLTTSYFRTIEIESLNGTTEVELSRDERPLGSARLDFSIGIRYHL